MLVKFIRLFRGYVDFEARGKFPERFLNITNRYGINLWNARPISDGIEGSMYISDYRKIRFIAKKSKVTAKITKKHGLPFLASKYKIRIGLPIGAVAGVIILVVLSNFIWSVKITGTETISETMLREMLAENGVVMGSYKNNLDVEKVERDIMLRTEEIGWMSINLTGNIASIEIKEKAMKPNLNTEIKPCNIKARCDGVITNIKASKGSTKVLKGSGVTEGDLLVSGIIETKLNTLQYVRADAEVYADVNSYKELTLPKQCTYYTFSDNINNRKRAFFLWFDFPCTLSFSSYEQSLYSKKTENLICNGEVLPLGIKTETEKEIVKTEVTFNKTTAEKVFTNSMLLYEAFEKGESTVKSRIIDINNEKNRYNYEIEYIFNENIAKSVEFNVTD